MAGHKPSSAPPLDRDQILEFVRKNPHAAGKREISRAFGLNVEQKRELKKILREMQLDGTLQRGRGRRLMEAGQLPAVCVVEIVGPDDDGELIAKPLNWEQDQPPPLIFMAPERPGQPALGRGDRALVRLTGTEKHGYQGKTIRRIAAAPARILGILAVSDDEFRIRPTDRRAKGELFVHRQDLNGAEAGDLVHAEILPGRHLGLRHARVLERLDALGGKVNSLISIHQYEIPTDFPADALRLANKARGAGPNGRVDVRHVPLVTIDGADARDFDDAVWAEKDPDPGNPEGWHLMVAIADVAWYVRPGDALDREAYKRGNSVYFPDRVVPMLPEALSNGWCSLVPNEDRPCLIAEMWIDAQGNLRRHKFFRALMRSVARLTYVQVQAARDGRADETTARLAAPVLTPLYGAYAALDAARTRRHALDLDLPERQVQMTSDGAIKAIIERQRLDSHKLIEEFMITANVAAAQALERKHQPCMYRIHDRPTAEKLTMLSEFLESINLRYASGQEDDPGQFNLILQKAAGTSAVHMVNQIILRTQAQAAYHPGNIGHFGLSLTKYCHFTSPIRRYSDLLVHRALITGYGLGQGGLGPHENEFEAIGDHISATERRAAAAERDTIERFVAEYMSARVGATFTGRINGVTRFGLFVTLDETGADGLIPISTLSGDYYELDEGRHALIGRQSSCLYRLGQEIDVRLLEASPVTGGLIFAVVDSGGPSSSHAPARSVARRGTSARKPGRQKKGKTRRK